MIINKYVPFAFLYFFLNSLALPFGLTYTALLSPLLYCWIVSERKKELLLPFFVCLSPFIIAHAIQGVDIKTYIVSIINYTLVYIFCQAFYTFLKKCTDIGSVFKKILVLNFIFCVIALPVYFTPFDSLLWMDHAISTGIENVSRLKLFTYEASYYAVLFTPLFFFFFVQLILKQNKINSLMLLVMLLLPYILSFSIGAISCVMLSCLLTYIVYARRLTKKKRVVTLLLLAGTFSIAALVLLWIFFPQNNIFLRMENIFLGKDTSGNGRTFEAFMLAMKMLDLKSHAWGIGAGQVKILGADIIRSYYLYDLDYNNIAIPNAAAETLAIFGWIGLSLRVLIELFLFFYTKVWTNYFRLSLFLFIFVYQFTGSFVTNIAEYVIWILAFTNVFAEFNVEKKWKVKNYTL